MTGASKRGPALARDSVKTTGSASQLVLAPDRATLAADGKDLAYVTLRIADQAGLTVPVADNQVKLGIDGPGDLVAVDNGNASDMTSFQDPAHRAFIGLVMAVVRTRAGQPGTITLHASSANLTATQTTVISH
jgi:beta-galactosidase